MTRPTAFTTPIVALALCSLVWLSSLAPALAATVTDTFRLEATGKDWCRSDSTFNAFNVKAAQGVTITFTRDVLNTDDFTDIQATINNSGNATIDAVTLNGRALPVNESRTIAQLVLSGRDPGNPDHFMTLRGKATLGKAGNLTKVTGKFDYQILSGLGGAPSIDCLGSGTFVTGKKPGLPEWAKAKFEAYVKASNTEASDNFGASVGDGAVILHSVALSGDTLAVGAVGEDSNATGTTGTQEEQDNNSAANSGAVYVFTRDNGDWQQQAYLKASNTDATRAGDSFGSSVALSGDGNTLAVGAYKEDSNAKGVDPGTIIGNQTNNLAADSGAVYVFTRDTAELWSQQAYVKASNTDAGDGFGISVALSGDGNTLAVGARNEGSDATGVNMDETNNRSLKSGAVYVFTRTGGFWSQQAYVKASNTAVSTAVVGDEFGFSVALAGDGNTLAVGAWKEDSNAKGVEPGTIIGSQTNNSAGDSGAVYVFTRDTAELWSQQAYVKASNTKTNTSFGYSVALDGDTLAVGSPLEDSPESSGAVYVFTRTGGFWSQQAYVKASNTDAQDRFGTSVALSGDTLAVGAHAESSNATLINGDQTNNSISSSGAAYVFTRTGQDWNQKAYVKASNTRADSPPAGGDDRFGGSVALAGDTLAVGAEREDSNAKGVNGNQTNNLALNSGAVYVYRAPPQ